MRACGRCGAAVGFWGALAFNAQTNRCRRCEEDMRRAFYPVQAAFQASMVPVPLDRVAQMRHWLSQNNAALAEAATFVGAYVDGYLCRLLDGDFGRVDNVVPYMRQIRQQLGLTNMPGTFYQRFVANTQRFGDLDSMPLNPRQCALHLEPNEECYVSSYQCSHLRENRSGTRAVPGNLVLTDRRLIFAAGGPTGDHELPWRRVEGVRVRRRRLALEVSVKRPSWKGPNTLERQYEVDEPLILAELADKIRSRPVLVTGRSRHIPEDVREAVFRRDGGRCVLCGSAEDIHYDHIIPFSRGGANTVANIRILCQRCNLSRGNRIRD